uniref:Rid family detoxifying hydrolase n=1 Tax=uncultured Bilophila sp. TaxID=529385 RepID=UPI0025D019D3|nr:Rid family detoxifying hydrolase [uncultured Bilophila sp.]
MKTILATAKAPAAIGPYSQGIKSGETLYLSGQLGIDPATGKLAEGVGAQTEQSLKNVRSLLAEAGASVEDVVKVTVFIADMEDFPLVNAAYSKVFTVNPPARSCVAVKALPLGGAVEIEVTAVVR